MTEVYVNWSDSTSNEIDRISYQSMLSRLDDINRQLNNRGLDSHTIEYCQQLITGNRSKCEFKLGKCSIIVTKISQ